MVDDEQNAPEALRAILSEEGYEVAEARDGEEALARLQDLALDLVRSDVRMMDGLTLLARARSRAAMRSS